MEPFDEVFAINPDSSVHALRFRLLVAKEAQAQFAGSGLCVHVRAIAVWRVGESDQFITLTPAFMVTPDPGWPFSPSAVAAAYRSWKAGSDLPEDAADRRAALAPCDDTPAPVDARRLHDAQLALKSACARVQRELSTAGERDRPKIARNSWLRAPWLGLAGGYHCSDIDPGLLVSDLSPDFAAWVAAREAFSRSGIWPALRGKPPALDVQPATRLLWTLRQACRGEPRDLTARFALAALPDPGTTSAREGALENAERNLALFQAALRKTDTAEVLLPEADPAWHSPVKLDSVQASTSKLLANWLRADRTTRNLFALAGSGVRDAQLNLCKGGFREFIAIRHGAALQTMISLPAGHPDLLAPRGTVSTEALPVGRSLRWVTADERQDLDWLTERHPGSVKFAEVAPGHAAVAPPAWTHVRHAADDPTGNGSR